MALLSTPGPRRRIPNPVIDPPSKWVWLEGERYGEVEFGACPALSYPPVMVDATPHRSASEKVALAAIARPASSPYPQYSAPWEGSTPPAKKSWLHMESVLPPISAQSPGACPQVMWGCLASTSFPGENALVDDPSLAERHLLLHSELARATGHPSLPTTPLLPPPAPSLPPPPPPGAGVGFFSWIKEPLPTSMSEGPLGRGWGRMGDEARRTYHLTSGRNDPGMLRICGFSYATTEGVLALEFADEAEAISAGLSTVMKSRYTSNVTVESVHSFKLFTLLRAASSGVVLPDWLIFPPGRCWLSGMSKFAPSGEDDPYAWVMRTGVACGEQTCSRMIPEPGSSWIRGAGNPGIAARAMVSAITRSPYFNMGNDPAPDLISRREECLVTP